MTVLAVNVCLIRAEPLTENQQWSPDRFVRIGQFYYLADAVNRGAVPTSAPNKRGAYSVNPARLSVLLKDGVSRSAAAVSLSSNGFAISERPFFRNWYTVHVPDSVDIMSALLSLRAAKELKHVEPVIMLESFAFPDDPPADQYYASQWNLPKVMAEQAWRITTGLDDILITVIDDGVDETHATNSSGDMWKNYRASADWDYTVNWPNGQDGPWATATGDTDSHGTACIGIIGAITNGVTSGGTTRGIAGLAGGNDSYDLGVDVTMIKTNLESDELAAAIDKARLNGSDILSCSWGVRKGTVIDIVREAIEDAYSAGIVCVFSAGNWEEASDVGWPARMAETIAVGATKSNDFRANYNDWGLAWDYIDNEWYQQGSSHGSNLDMMAPGHQIYTLDRWGTNGYSSTEYFSSFGGTSAAAPHAAATAGLLLSVNPNLTHTQIREILLQTADKANPGTYSYTGSGPRGYGGWNNEMGYGRLNAYKAVLAAQTGTASISTAVTWYAASTPIYGNLTVPAGVTVTLADGASLAFYSGKSLTVNGTLVFQGNNALSFNNGGSLVLNSANTLGSGKTLTITGGDLTVGSSGSFTIEAGAALTFTDGADLVSNGSVTINGTQANPVTFSFSGGGSLVLNSANTLASDKTLTITGGSLTVGSSGSFTVGAGCALTFKDGLQVDGSVTINGTQNSPVTLKFDGGSAVNVVGSLAATYANFTLNTGYGYLWGGIYKGNSTGTLQLTNCTVSRANFAGVTVNAPTVGPLVQILGGNYSDNDRYGIYINRASGASFIRGVTIEGTDYLEGVRVLNSAMTIGGYSYPQVVYNLIHDNERGMTLINYSGTFSYNKVYDNENEIAMFDTTTNVWLESSGPTMSSNTICYRDENNDPSYDATFVGSSPYITDTWFYGAMNAELYLSYSSYPTLIQYDVGNNGIHTAAFDNGGSVGGQPAVGRATYAILFGYYNNANSIYAESNWWGKYPMYEWDFESILSDPDYVVTDWPLSSPPAFSPPTKPARSTAEALSSDRSVIQQGVAAELSGDFSQALMSYQKIVADYPNSPFVHQALERAYATMTKAGASMVEMEPYFAAVSRDTTSLSAFARSTAAELQRRAMAFHGDLDRAITAYRAVAEDNSESPDGRWKAWYRIVRLADEKGDSALVNAALSHVLADGVDPNIACFIRREWGDRVRPADKPVAVSEEMPRPAGAVLAAYPNPFNPATTIRFTLPEQSSVRLVVFDLNGRVVRTLVDRPMLAGTHSVVWDGRDALGRNAASGAYLYTITTSRGTSTKRMVLVR